MFCALSCKHRSFNAIVKTADSFSRPPLSVVSPHRFTQTAALTPCPCFRWALHILYLLHFVACRQLVRHLHCGFAGEGRRSVVRARVHQTLSDSDHILNFKWICVFGSGRRQPACLFNKPSFVHFVISQRYTVYMSSSQKTKAVPVIQFSLLPLA